MAKQKQLPAAKFNDFFSKVLTDTKFRSEFQKNGLAVLEKYGIDTSKMPAELKSMLAGAKKMTKAQRRNVCGVCGLCGLCGICAEVNAGSVGAASAALWNLL